MAKESYEISAIFPEQYKKLSIIIDELINLVQPDSEDEMYSLQAHINNTISCMIMEKVIFGDSERKRITGWKINK